MWMWQPGAAARDKLMKSCVTYWLCPPADLLAATALSLAGWKQQLHPGLQVLERKNGITVVLLKQGKKIKQNA